MGVGQQPQQCQPAKTQRQNERERNHQHACTPPGHERDADAKKQRALREHAREMLEGSQAKAASSGAGSSRARSGRAG